MKTKTIAFTKQAIKSSSIYKWYGDKQFAMGENRRNQQKRASFVEQILPKNGIGAELGVHRGYFSPMLMELTIVTKLHLIDPWYFLTSHWHWGSGNRSTVEALIKILQRFKSEIESGRVLVHVGDDLQILPTFPDQYFDWVYIDSSHAYEHTRDELQILDSKVKDIGVIAGDDWQPDPSHQLHGVYKAVNEFVNFGNYEIVYSDSSNAQWAIKRKS